MHTFIQRRFRSTIHYSISEEGLSITKKTLKGETTRIIPYENLEVIDVKTTVNEFLFGGSMFLFFSAFVHIFISKTDHAIASSFFAFPMSILTLCTMRTSLYNESLDKKIISILPFRRQKKKLKLFFKNLEDTKNRILLFRFHDEVYGTEFEKQFVNIINLYKEGKIDVNEFWGRKRRLIWSTQPDPRNGPFYN